MDDSNVWIAASDGDLLRVQNYIESGCFGVNQFDENGYLPLSAAISYEHLHVAEYLISKGADVNLCGESLETPLFYAETLACVDFLIKNGANINVVNDEGDTLLDNALMNEITELYDYYKSLNIPYKETSEINEVEYNW